MSGPTAAGLGPLISPARSKLDKIVDYVTAGLVDTRETQRVLDLCDGLGIDLDASERKVARLRHDLALAASSLSLCKTFFAGADHRGLAAQAVDRALAALAGEEARDGVH